MKRKKIIHLAFLLVLLSFFVLPIFAFAQTQFNISSAIPGVNANTTSSSPGAFVANFYHFALIIGGVLAFGVIVYGGVLYMTSSGNPSGASEAKQWIEAALLGLLLLAGAYFILGVVNPQLLNLNLPSLMGADVNVSNISVPGTGTGGKPPTTSTATAGTGCAGGGTCAVLPNCTTVAGKTNCGGAPALAAVLGCVNNSDPNYSVNEGYPPTVTHSDPGHNDGCAIDVHVSSCAAGAAFISAAKTCGASKVLNEYSGCAGSSIYKTTTGGNIHIDAPKGQGGC